MPTGGLEPASTDHVTNTAAGAAIGAVATGVAVAAAGTLMAPLVAGAAVIGLPIVAVGGLLGGWIGYNKAQAKAMRHGIRKS
jgi:hypothetical protein